MLFNKLGDNVKGGYSGLWDEDIFISSLYFIHKPVHVLITYYLYNQKNKTNSKKKRHTEDAFVMWNIIMRSLFLEVLRGFTLPDWKAAAVLEHPTPEHSI